MPPAKGTAVATTEKPTHEISTATAQEFTPEQKQLIKNVIAKDHSDDEVKVFLMVANTTGLNPFARQIYSIKRQGKQTIQTAIDGFRLIARRTGFMDGYEPTLWCGQDGKWTDVWLDVKPPAAAKVTVYRKGDTHPYTSVAKFASYRADGPLWNKMPEVMIAKCAESLALRQAFPQELSGLYTSEEMAQAGGQDHIVDASIQEAPAQEAPKQITGQSAAHSGSPDKSKPATATTNTNKTAGAAATSSKSSAASAGGSAAAQTAAKSASTGNAASTSGTTSVPKSSPAKPSTSAPLPSAQTDQTTGAFGSGSDAEDAEIIGEDPEDLAAFKVRLDACAAISEVVGGDDMTELLLPFAAECGYSGPDLNTKFGYKTAELEEINAPEPITGTYVKEGKLTWDLLLRLGQWLSDNRCA